MITAKPVIPNQFWILKEDDRKIGNIEVNDSGYSVRINNSVTNYKTLSMLKERVSVDFQEAMVKSSPEVENQVHGFPTEHYPHNPVMDVRQQLPLYTCEPRSRSWYAAGWYRVQQHRTWEAVLSPKLILLQRYRYQGPFRTQAEAEAR